MEYYKKIRKLLSNPFKVLDNRLSGLYEKFRFKTLKDYRAVNYWNYRHKRFGFNLRGVGDMSKTHEENVILLNEGARVFLQVCKKANVNFNDAKVLDIGCGTGHFAKVLKNKGVKDYRGIDIVDTLFKELKVEFPEYEFDRLDVSSQKIQGNYNLILAMDVLQHIVNEEKFHFAINNIKSSIAHNGTIIISTPLGTYKKLSFYCVIRPLEVYYSLFPDFEISEPIRYADSYVFSLQRRS